MVEVVGNTLALIGLVLVLAFWLSGVLDDDNEDL